MKTLKLKHLAPYLPYKLKIMVKMGDNSWKQFELVVSDLENFEDKSSFY